MITEDIYEVELPTCIEKNWNVYQYKSFARGYHAYMNIWSPLVGEILQCRHKASNEVDENAIAIIRPDFFYAHKKYSYIQRYRDTTLRNTRQHHREHGNT